MTNENGALSIDFLVGFTIFLLAFIWVVSMIPGLLIGLQGYTIDYDAVAYRTSVILVEDPGEPALPLAVHPWEYLTDPRDVVRFGLALSKDTPNILSQDKVNRFFCSTAFSYPRDYQNKTIFGDYPYRFNISLMDTGSNKTLSLGDEMSPDSSYGTIRRLVKIKGTSYAAINATNFTNGGDDTSQHDFTILIDQNELLTVSDPIYQINPGKENIMINITNINSTLGNRTPCFDINLSKRITLFSKDPYTGTFYTIGYFDDPVIDGKQYNLSFTPPYGINNNISMILNPNFVPWSNYKQVYVTLTFDLNKSSSAPSFCNNLSGSWFLNNTPPKSPFDYNYDQKNVTQADLRDAVLEVDIGSGYRTITETLIEYLKSKFTWDPPASKTITFRDLSTGSPISWEWNFGDGTPNGTTSIITHSYALPGIYWVTLTVEDTNGVTDSSTQTIDLSAPVASFSGAPVSGTTPLNVQFTDSSTGGTIISWKWEYNKTTAGSWTQFNTTTTQNPLKTFTNGTYDIRLTVSNMFGNNTVTKPSFVTAIPPAPVASFNTAPSPATGNTPFVVTFTDTSTGGTPDTWDWDFGDGSPHSNVQNPVHTYIGAGSHTAQLTVSNAGGSSSATKPIIVNSPPPTLTARNPNNGNRGWPVSVTLTGTGFQPGATVNMTRGGIVINAYNVVVVSPISLTCTFDLVGATAANNWAIRVTNPDGQSSGTVSFTVNSPNPTVTAITPPSGQHGTTVTITNIAGTGFQPGVTEVRFSRDTGTLHQILLTNINVVSSTQISGTLVIPAGQTVETLYVRVTNADATTGISGSRIFSVLT